MKQEQKKEQGKRRTDPEPRFHDVTASWVKLRNKDPNRHYVYVNKGDAAQGVEYYQSIGYEIEHYREGGVQPHGKQEPGSEIEKRGHVLMSISNEDHAKLVMYGPDGVTGQAAQDRLEAEAIGFKKRGQVDHLRGQHGRPMISVINETSPATPE